MFALLHSDINLHKSGLLYLTGQPYCKKSRSAKVKGGIINLLLRSYLLYWYKVFWWKSQQQRQSMYLPWPPWAEPHR